MKRYGGLWEQVTSWPNLLLAARKAQRGKRSKHDVRNARAHGFGQRGVESPGAAPVPPGVRGGRIGVVSMGGTGATKVPLRPCL